jgi:hypothetical protein
MAFVHECCQEGAVSELDLFSLPLVQCQLESGSFVEYNPISSLTDSTPIEFHVSGSGQDYIDLSNTQIYIKAQIVQPDGTDIDNAHHVGPVNNLLHSLFSEVDLKLNDTLVSSTNNTYAYRAYLENLLSFGPAAKHSQLTSEMFYKDSSAGIDESNPHVVNGLNAGFRKRHSFFEDSAVANMLGNLHLDAMYQSKLIPSDVNLKIRLVRNKDAFCLMSSHAGVAYKIKIVECKLFIRKAKLMPSVFVAHAKELEKTSAKYPIRRVVCKTFTIPRGNQDYSQESLFSGQVPIRLVCGLVLNTAYNGTYNTNPFNFRHFNATEIRLYIDGQQSTVRPLTPNFAAGTYLPAYNSLFSACGKQGRDVGNDITCEDYARGYSLYCFDLTSDLSSGHGGHFQLVREGSVRLDLKFSAALADTINVVVYAEMENVLEIDRNRNVIADFSS